MLIPVIIVLVLIALIMATAKKFKVSGTIPLAIAIAMFGVFVLAARGIIPVAKEQFQMILSNDLAAIALFGALAAVIFFQAYVWMKQKASRSKK